jgi:hypothetical protein
MFLGEDPSLRSPDSQTARSVARGSFAALERSMPRKKRQAAEEVAAELANDPKYQARIAKRDRRLEEFAREFAGEDHLISAEAAVVGYNIESVWDFVNNTPHPVLHRPFVGAYARAYPLLIRHLHLPHHPRIREGIVRALTVRDGGQPVWAALLEEFEVEKDPEMRWVIANALITAMPYRRRKEFPEIAEVRYGRKRSNKVLKGRRAKRARP